MNILTVIPITKGFFGEELTYFTKDEVSAGAIVAIPLRTKIVPALVSRVQPASEVKTALRQSAFSLKKIVGIISPHFFLEPFLTAAYSTADYFAAPVSQIIKSFTPQAVLAQAGEPVGREAGQLMRPGGGFKPESFVLQEADQERSSFYRSLIREAFAKNHSVLCLFPGPIELERGAPELTKGIEEFTVLLHAQLPPKELLTRWRQVLQTGRPLLVVATPLFLSLPRPDIRTLIIEHEASELYKDRFRPFADARVMAELLAQKAGWKLVAGDLGLRTETVFRAERGELMPIVPLKYRSSTTAEQKLIVSERVSPHRGEVPALSAELSAELEHRLASGDKILILAGRRGLSSLTVCQDCGLIKVCRTCGAPLVLHPVKNQDRRVFLCHRCGAEDERLEQCEHCGGWRLLALGAGLDRLEQLVKKNFRDLPYWRLDAETTKTAKERQAVADKFSRAQTGLLLGTGLALAYLTDKIPTVIVTGFDSVLSRPDLRSGEKVMVTLLRARQLAGKRFYLETRQPAEKVYRYALEGNLLDFYRDELSDRRQLSWPPFVTLIKLTTAGFLPKINQQREHLINSLKSEVQNVYSLLQPDRRPRRKQAVVILELPASNWPQSSLLVKLRSLPPDWQVEIDPGQLF